VYGWPAQAPYDRILVSASADAIPPELLDQLAAPGKLVIPVGQTIHEITRNARGELKDSPHGGFLFVPLLPPEDNR
jgi:protein-L-isoaspartate(D-aspartate) O-methyltransferase